MIGAWAGRPPPIGRLEWMPNRWNGRGEFLGYGIVHVIPDRLWPPLSPDAFAEDHCRLLRWALWRARRFALVHAVGAFALGLFVVFMPPGPMTVVNVVLMAANLSGLGQMCAAAAVVKEELP